MNANETGTPASHASGKQETQTVQARGQRDRDASPRVGLLFSFRETVKAVALKEGDSLVVGRAEPANLCVPDPSVSRLHARFRLQAGQLTVSDLESSNGTHVRGEAVEEAVLSPYDEVLLGDVSVVAQPLSPRTLEEADGPLGYDACMALLDAELARANWFGRPLALALLRPTDDGHGALATSWLARRYPVERIGRYGADRLLLMLPELDAAAARARVDALLGSDTPAPWTAGVIAAPPRSATRQALLRQASAALKRATREHPVALSDASRPADADATDAVVRIDGKMQAIDATLRRVAPRPIPVLIGGETGVGKEHLVRALHRYSQRSGPLKTLNCGALPRELTESILFGHEKGAFTGAGARSRGLFEEADGGTLFLDEIGELPMGAQAALLRVLQEGRLVRVGATREIEVDVRIVAATHRDLFAQVEAGAFRQDLLYRLNPVHIQVPPLRERPSEIVPMAERFLGDAVRDWGGAALGLSAAAKRALLAHHWPGNVRELRNAMERAAALCTEEWVQPADLQPSVHLGHDDATGLESASAEPGALTNGTAAPVSALPPSTFDTPAVDLRAQLRAFETQLIETALQQHDGRVGKAAEALGIPVRTLSFKMRSLGIRR